jgi:hypothetical protein
MLLLCCQAELWDKLLRWGRKQIEGRAIPQVVSRCLPQRWPGFDPRSGNVRFWKKFNDLIRARIRYFPACSIVPQPTNLPRWVKQYAHAVFQNSNSWWNIGYVPRIRTRGRKLRSRITTDPQLQKKRAKKSPGMIMGTFILNSDYRLPLSEFVP